jgi:hypothetical protein
MPPNRRWQAASDALCEWQGGKVCVTRRAQSNDRGLRPTHSLYPCSMSVVPRIPLSSSLSFSYMHRATTQYYAPGIRRTIRMAS